MNHKGSPFPLVAEKIEEELEDYRSKEEDIKRMKSDMGLESGNENDAAIGLLSDNTQVEICFILHFCTFNFKFPVFFPTLQTKLTAVSKAKSLLEATFFIIILK